MSLHFASWNQLTQWLRELDALRLVARRRNQTARDSAPGMAIGQTLEQESDAASRRGAITVFG
jgi:hypothetical protein